MRFYSLILLFNFQNYFNKLKATELFWKQFILPYNSVVGLLHKLGSHAT